LVHIKTYYHGAQSIYFTLYVHRFFIFYFLHDTYLHHMHTHWVNNLKFSHYWENMTCKIKNNHYIYIHITKINNITLRIIKHFSLHQPLVAFRWSNIIKCTPITKCRPSFRNSFFTYLHSWIPPKNWGQNICNYVGIPILHLCHNFGPCSTNAIPYYKT
jgi:hypothetical protein